MQVIDKKGKIFGKINIIDLAIIILLIIGIIVTVQFISKHTEPPMYETKYIKLRVDKISEDVLEKAKSGDREIYKKTSIAELMNITSEENKEISNTRNAWLIFKISVTIKDEELVYPRDNQITKLGSELNIKTKTHQFRGEVERITDSEEELYKKAN